MILRRRQSQLTVGGRGVRGLRGHGLSRRIGIDPAALHGGRPRAGRRESDRAGETSAPQRCAARPRPRGERPRRADTRTTASCRRAATPRAPPLVPHVQRHRKRTTTQAASARQDPKDFTKVSRTEFRMGNRLNLLNTLRKSPLRQGVERVLS